MKSTINMKSMINMTSMIHSRKKKQFLEKIEYFDYYFIFVFLFVRPFAVKYTISMLLVFKEEYYGQKTTIGKK